MSQITGSKPFVKGTKTGSVRRVPLAGINIDALRRQRARQKEDRLACGPGYILDPSEPVFTNEFGERLTPQAATTAFGDIARAARVSSTRCHDLRHTTASYRSCPETWCTKKVGERQLARDDGGDSVGHIIADGL